MTTINDIADGKYMEENFSALGLINASESVIMHRMIGYYWLQLSFVTLAWMNKTGRMKYEENEINWLKGAMENMIIGTINILRAGKSFDINNVIDSGLMARQMLYFMSGEYAKDLPLAAEVKDLELKHNESPIPPEKVEAYRRLQSMFPGARLEIPNIGMLKKQAQEWGSYVEKDGKWLGWALKTVNGSRYLDLGSPNGKIPLTELSKAMHVLGLLSLKEMKPGLREEPAPLNALGIEIKTDIEEELSATGITQAQKLAVAVEQAIVSSTKPFENAAGFEELEQALAARTGKKVVTYKANGPAGSMLLGGKAFGFSSYNPENDEYMVSEGFWEHFQTDAERGAVLQHEKNEYNWLNKLENKGKSFEVYHNNVINQKTNIKKNKPDSNDWTDEEKAVILEAQVINIAESLLNPALKDWKFNKTAEIIEIISQIVPGVELAEKITINELFELMPGIGPWTLDRIVNGLNGKTVTSTTDKRYILHLEKSKFESDTIKVSFRRDSGELTNPVIFMSVKNGFFNFDAVLDSVVFDLKEDDDSPDMISLAGQGLLSQIFGRLSQYLSEGTVASPVHIVNTPTKQFIAESCYIKDDKLMYKKGVLVNNTITHKEQDDDNDLIVVATIEEENRNPSKYISISSILAQTQMGRVMQHAGFTEFYVTTQDKRLDKLDAFKFLVNSTIKKPGKDIMEVNALLYFTAVKTGAVANAVSAQNETDRTAPGASANALGISIYEAVKKALAGITEEAKFAVDAKDEILSEKQTGNTDESGKTAELQDTGITKKVERFNLAETPANGEKTEWFIPGLVDGVIQKTVEDKGSKALNQIFNERNMPKVGIVQMLRNVYPDIEINENTLENKISFKYVDSGVFKNIYRLEFINNGQPLAIAMEIGKQNGSIPDEEIESRNAMQSAGVPVTRYGAEIDLNNGSKVVFRAFVENEDAEQFISFRGKKEENYSLLVREKLLQNILKSYTKAKVFLFDLHIRNLFISKKDSEPVFFDVSVPRNEADKQFIEKYGFELTALNMFRFGEYSGVNMEKADKVNPAALVLIRKYYEGVPSNPKLPADPAKIDWDQVFRSEWNYTGSDADLFDNASLRKRLNLAEEAMLPPEEYKAINIELIHARADSKQPDIDNYFIFQMIMDSDGRDGLQRLYNMYKDAEFRRSLSEHSNLFPWTGSTLKCADRFLRDLEGFLNQPKIQSISEAVVSVNEGAEVVDKSNSIEKNAFDKVVDQQELVQSEENKEEIDQSAEKIINNERQNPQWLKSFIVAKGNIFSRVKMLIQTVMMFAVMIYFTSCNDADQTYGKYLYKEKPEKIKSTEGFKVMPDVGAQKLEVAVLQYENHDQLNIIDDIIKKLPRSTHILIIVQDEFYANEIAVKIAEAKLNDANIKILKIRASFLPKISNNRIGLDVKGITFWARDNTVWMYNPSTGKFTVIPVTNENIVGDPMVGGELGSHGVGIGEQFVALADNPKVSIPGGDVASFNDNVVFVGKESVAANAKINGWTTAKVVEEYENIVNAKVVVLPVNEVHRDRYLAFMGGDKCVITDPVMTARLLSKLSRKERDKIISGLETELSGYKFFNKKKRERLIRDVSYYLNQTEEEAKHSPLVAQLKKAEKVLKDHGVKEVIHIPGIFGKHVVMGVYFTNFVYLGNGEILLGRSGFPSLDEVAERIYNENGLKVKWINDGPAAAINGGDLHCAVNTGYSGTADFNTEYKRLNGDNGVKAATQKAKSANRKPGARTLTLPSTYAIGEFFGFSERAIELFLAPFVAVWDMPLHFSKIVADAVTGKGLDKSRMFGGLGIIAATAATAFFGHSLLAVYLAYSISHFIYNLIFKGATLTLENSEALSENSGIIYNNPASETGKKDFVVIENHSELSKRLEEKIPASVREVLDKLVDKGEVYIFGGAVRDAALDVKAKDWDIRTDATPAQIEELFPEAVCVRRSDSITIYEIMLPDGISMDLVSKKGVEIYFKQSAAISFTNMGYNYRLKELFDYNNGLNDLKNKIIYMPHPSAATWKDTVSRYIEAYTKLNATYGGFTFEKTTEDFIRNYNDSQADDWHVVRSLYYCLKFSPSIFFEITTELGLFDKEYFPELGLFNKDKLAKCFSSIEDVPVRDRLVVLLDRIDKKFNTNVSSIIAQRIQKMVIPAARVKFLPEEMIEFLSAIDHPAKYNDERLGKNPALPGLNALTLPENIPYVDQSIAELTEQLDAAQRPSLEAQGKSDAEIIKIIEAQVKQRISGELAKKEFVDSLNPFAFAARHTNSEGRVKRAVGIRILTALTYGPILVLGGLCAYFVLSGIGGSAASIISAIAVLIGGPAIGAILNINFHKAWNIQNWQTPAQLALATVSSQFTISSISQKTVRLIGEHESDVIKAINNNDPDFILAEFKKCQTNGHFDKEKVISLIESCCGPVEELYKTYTVQATWRVTKAVQELASAEKTELLDILYDYYTTGVYGTGEKPLPQLIVSMFLLRVKRDYKESLAQGAVFNLKEHKYKKIYELMAKQLKSLEGRCIYTVSPEITSKAGGLGPVMEFLGGGENFIIKNFGIADASNATIELWYRNNGEDNPLDYLREYGVSIEAENDGKTLKSVIPEFKVNIGGTERRVRLYRGWEVADRNNPNSEHIKNRPPRYFLHDVDGQDGKGYRSASNQLYKYREEGKNQNMDNAAKYESVAFLSCAAAEAIRRLEAERQEKLGKNWRPAVVHGNDGQCGYLAAVILSRYKDDPLMNKALHYFTTHTYFNRGTWNVEDVKKYLKYLGIDPKYWKAIERF